MRFQASAIGRRKVAPTDPGLKGKLAHKGAAVLRRVEKSERLSRDLDSADIRGERVDTRLIMGVS